MMDLNFSNIFPVSRLMFGCEPNDTKRFVNNLFHVHVKPKELLKPQISQIKIKDNRIYNDSPEGGVIP